MHVTQFKDWSLQQSSAAFAALKAHSERHEESPVRSPDSLQVVTERILSGVLQAAFIDGYLLVYDIGPTWSTREDLLYELLLIRAMPGGTFADYVSGLRQIARQRGCFGILTGNGVVRPGLRRRYEQVGFVKFNEAYYLEV